MFESPIAVGILLGVVALAIAGGFYIAYRLMQPKWLPLPGLVAKYVAYAGWPGTPQKIATCLTQAATIIGQTTKSTPAQMQQLLAKVYVSVHAGETWVDSFGRTIGGELDDNVILVCNQSLDVLCHELCHAWDFMFTGNADDNHTLWPTNGLSAADQQYRAWLASSGL